MAANVADSADVKRVVEEVEAKYQRIHVLVNNAGITRDGLMLRMEDDAWQEVIDTNLKGTFLFSRAVGAVMMRARYGRIINISSVAGLVGNPGQANYSASKAGVIGFSKTVARELASRGITVNVVAPGFITTDMTDILPEKIKTEVKERIPLRQVRNARGHRRPGLLPGQPRCQLHHRPGDRGRWRPDRLSRLRTEPLPERERIAGRRAFVQEIDASGSRPGLGESPLSAQRTPDGQFDRAMLSWLILATKEDRSGPGPSSGP